MGSRAPGAGRTAAAAAGGGGGSGGGGLGRRRPQQPGLACQGAGGSGSSTMSLQYGAEETPLAGGYGAADSFPGFRLRRGGGGRGGGSRGRQGWGGGRRRLWPGALTAQAGDSAHGPAARRQGPPSRGGGAVRALRPPSLPSGSAGSQPGGGPEEGGGRGGRLGCPSALSLLWEAEPGRGTLGGPRPRSTPRSAEAEWIPHSLSGRAEAGARGLTSWALTSWDPAPMPFMKLRLAPRFPQLSHSLPDSGCVCASHFR